MLYPIKNSIIKDLNKIIFIEHLQLIEELNQLQVQIQTFRNIIYVSNTKKELRNVNE